MHGNTASYSTTVYDVTAIRVVECLSDGACEYCGSAVHHEHWCMTLNTEISYAYKIVMEPTALTVGMPSPSGLSAGFRNEA
jgi:hypothetical protein